ncbi:hypothetical protein HDU92_005127 [Lobulomyces angularis]|nr:hypothetical protein HDU92_005127 [Lobulomyces angularis]
MRQKKKRSIILKKALIIFTVYTIVSTLILFLTIDKNFYDDDNKLQQNVLETTKKFHTTNYKTKLPLKQRRVSNLDCSHIKHTCLISNLYYINKSFKVYVGKNFNRSEISYLQDVRILTGIGHGSHSFRLNFILEKSNLTTVALPTTTSIISEKQPLFNQIEQKKKLNNTVTVDGHEIPTKKKFNLLENTSKQYEIDVFLEDPPESFNLPDDTEYVMEPTSFFSVLWSNLFRTIYSGVGAWYTQMYYNVFFLDHHRFVLIDNDPHPTKFLAVLSVVTKFPVEFLDSINNTIFRAGVMGISKDVQVAEIDDEIYFEERFELRKKVFRDFCDHLKEKILNFEDFENYGHKIFHKIVKKIRKNKKQSLQLLNFQKKKYNNNSSSSNVLQLSLILREGETRKILNEDGLIEMLKTFSEFEVNIYRFSQLTLQKQIEIIDQTDVFITMHGAALTHLLFLKKNSFVVELFPYAFKKKIYSNLSKILSLNYLSWQNSDIKKSVLNFDIVKNNRLTFMPKKLIMQLPINWFNMDSKNYWRNQDTLINLDEVKYILKNNLLETFKNKNQNSDVRYFIYLPWEQLNNQIIGLKSACAVSNFLNRTLVIPDLGFRNPNSNTHKKLPSDFVFYKPADYIWKNIDRYLNSTNLLSLPCKQISLQNFKSLNKDLSINNIMYNHLSDETTSINQVKDYFQHVLKLKFNDIVFNPSIYYQLTKQEIFNFYGNNNQRVLAVSSMFWHYDFGYKQVFPLKNFHNYLHYGNENENLVVSDNIYEQISVGITYSERLMDLGGRLIKNIFKDVEEMNHQEYLSIHIRSGDYLEKCSKIFENLSCFINSTALIMENIEKHFDGHLINGGILYISTNEENFREVFKDLHVDFGGKFKKVLFLEDLLEDSEVDEGIEDNINLFDDNNKTINEIKDLVYEQDEEEKFGELPLRMDLDKLDQSILDQIICVNSKGFIGNYHSSFSRSIIENRIFKNKSWNVF